MDADNATVEIAISPHGTAPWWTVLWDGTRATVRTAPGLDGDTPDDWGIACTNPHYTDTWRDEGGTPYVVEQIPRRLRQRRRHSAHRGLARGGRGTETARSRAAGLCRRTPPVRPRAATVRGGDSRGRRVDNVACSM